MTDTNHHAYLDTVKQMAGAHWGRQYATDEAAQRALLEDLTLEGACLLGLIHRFDTIAGAITDAVVTARARELYAAADRMIADWIRPLELKHGPAPAEVRESLHSHLHRQIGRTLIQSEIIPTDRWLFIRKPATGTTARREYDKWIRRKAKTPQPPPKAAADA